LFIPLSDDNPLTKIEFQYMTLTLIAINVAISVFSVSGIEHGVVASFGVTPNELLASAGFAPAVAEGAGTLAVPESYTLVSYMFFHADILHLAGNMVFLWVFGDNVEDAIGHVKFLVFYLLCGILAGITHAVMMPDSSVTLIGASGAIAGVVAAYLMLHPRVQIWILALPIFTFKVSAGLALGAWVLYQVVMAIVPQGGPVAWWAHVGGLVAGALLILVFKRPGVKLFE